MIAIETRVEGMDVVERALAKLDPIDGERLLSGLGRMIQEQTRRRITEEKTAPSGSKWPPNRAGTPVLYRSGALARSIDFAVASDQVVVGSGLVDAGVHQNGATILPKKARRLVFRIGNRTIFAKKVTVPARPYLGISGENAEDILDATAKYLQSRLGGGS